MQKSKMIAMMTVDWFNLLALLDLLADMDTVNHTMLISSANICHLDGEGGGGQNHSKYIPLPYRNQLANNKTTHTTYKYTILFILAYIITMYIYIYVF